MYRRAVAAAEDRAVHEEGLCHVSGEVLAIDSHGAVREGEREAALETRVRVAVVRGWGRRGVDAPRRRHDGELDQERLVGGQGRVLEQARVWGVIYATCRDGVAKPPEVVCQHVTSFPIRVDPHLLIHDVIWVDAVALVAEV
jgi:hypothetical protein